MAMRRWREAMSSSDNRLMTRRSPIGSVTQKMAIARRSGILVTKYANNRDRSADGKCNEINGGL